jgi:hypothetical protein
MSETQMQSTLPHAMRNEDPPPDPTQTDDTSKTGSLPVEGADEPLGDPSSSNTSPDREI